ncbi:hypothetical protein Syun_000945 [Stephania yunnanensis]|uniref:Uncharacterized protein n=1 Tax=Stephania yunnanensis TaxID=152371 RepID=A0AAP0Q608_9MAGN
MELLLFLVVIDSGYADEVKVEEEDLQWQNRGRLELSEGKRVNSDPYKDWKSYYRGFRAYEYPKSIIIVASSLRAIHRTAGRCWSSASEAPRSRCPSSARYPSNLSALCWPSSVLPSDHPAGALLIEPRRHHAALTGVVGSSSMTASLLCVLLVL